MYILDSNIFILGFMGSKREKEILSQVVGRGELVLSVITVAEVLAKATIKEEQIFRDLMSRFPVLTVDMEVSEAAAKYRKKSIKTKKVHLIDCFLAAQAKLHKLTLVTNDKSDFPMKDIRIIKRYQNRKLYDTFQSCYVTLEEIS